MQPHPGSPACLADIAQLGHAKYPAQKPRNPKLVSVDSGAVPKVEALLLISMHVHVPCVWVTFAQIPQEKTL